MSVPVTKCPDCGRWWAAWVGAWHDCDFVVKEIAPAEIDTVAVPRGTLETLEKVRRLATEYVVDHPVAEEHPVGQATCCELLKALDDLAREWP